MRFSESKKEKAKKKFKKYYKYVLLVFFILGFAFSSLICNNEKKEKAPIKSFTELIEKIKKDDKEFEKITWNPNLQVVVVSPQKGNNFAVGVPQTNDKEGLNQVVKLAERKNITFSSLPVQTENDLAPRLLSIIPTMLIIAIIVIYLFYYGPLAKQKISKASSEINFKDVAGADEAIEELEDVRSFLADPKRYKKLGARVPKGVLLYGPPGTGKTLLAKAVASEADIPFYQSSGSEFVEMYAGLGARRVRQLFEEAKKHAPSIIFIDELDAVGGHRSGGSDGGTREADQTLIQLLKEIDGFTVSEHPVIIMGATNRREALDQALVRPGRFDRLIAIDPPDKEGRLKILKIHSQDKPLASNVDLNKIAVQTSGMAGADLARLLNEAALIAARHHQEEIFDKDIDDAYFRIIAGAKKQHRALKESERRTVAYHEAGHALVREKLKGPDKVHKISIIPRGQSGGQTIYVSEEDVFLYPENDLKDMLAALLAGRASEEIFMKRITSGAADDLERATDLAMKMVGKLGMGKVLGLRITNKDYQLSPEIQSLLDEEAKELLQDAYKKAKEIINDNKELLISVAEALLEEETIDRDRFLQLVSLPPETDEMELAS